SVGGEGGETSKKSDDGDYDSAQASEMAIGVEIPTKPATNSRKEARIAIYKELISFVSRTSQIGQRWIRPRADSAREIWISSRFPTHLGQGINVSQKPSYCP